MENAYFIAESDDMIVYKNRKAYECDGLPGDEYTWRLQKIQQWLTIVESLKFSVSVETQSKKGKDDEHRTYLSCLGSKQPYKSHLYSGNSQACRTHPERFCNT
jgi:hypothetical protein